MPPKVKFTKEQIVEAAFSLVREKGEEALTARNLAAALGTSTAPIFTAFSSIEEVQNTVVEKAKALYRRYFEEGLSQKIPFKGTGLKYVQFAKDEPWLFKMLFMRESSEEKPTHYMPSGDENEPLIRKSVEKSYELDSEKAKRLYNHLSVYTHGLAVLYACGNCSFTDDDVSRMLSEIFSALQKE